MRYLVETRQHIKGIDAWYPRHDFKTRALIDQYLDGHHLNLRLGCGAYVFRKFVMPALGKTMPPEMLNECNMARKRTFKVLNARKTSFICTEDRPTIADLAAFSEIR